VGERKMTDKKQIKSPEDLIPSYGYFPVNIPKDIVLEMLNTKNEKLVSFIWTLHADWSQSHD
jgi:hypothetical protein